MRPLRSLPVVAPRPMPAGPRLVLAAAALLAGAGCDGGPAAGDLDGRLRRALDAAGGGGAAFRLPDPADLAALPQDPRNPLTPAKVDLGRLLFHETALAVSPTREAGRGTYACATCHAAAAGFHAGLRQAIGEGGSGYGPTGRALDAGYRPSEADVQRVRTRSPLNGAWGRVAFWNGQFGAAGPNVGTEAAWLPSMPQAENHRGYEGLETQAIAALTVHRMRGGPAAVAARYPEYRRRFDAAFADRPAAERVSEETAGLALAAYERTLVATEAPFQRWLRGEPDAMTPAEKRGALAFFGPGRCAACHTGPALGGDTFHALGMADLGGPGFVGDPDPADPVHFGRGGFTGRDEDRFRFRTPGLYNLAGLAGFGHGASLATLRDVVRYKNAAVAESPYVGAHRLSPRFRPLGLSAAEVDDLTAFLERALYDPGLGRYAPRELPSGHCSPANDARSRRDLGCEPSGAAR